MSIRRTRWLRRSRRRSAASGTSTGLDTDDEERTNGDHPRLLTALVAGLVGDFDVVPGKIDLTVTLTRVMLPFLLWFSLSQQITGMGAISVELLPKVSDYLTLVTTLLMAFGLCFQLPVVLSLCGLAGLINSDTCVVSPDEGGSPAPAPSTARPPPPKPASTNSSGS